MDIPCFAINLVRAEHRRRHVLDEARKAGLTVELVEAVDGRAMEAAELRRHAPSNWAMLDLPLAPGEIGCTLSHAKVLRMIVERGLPRALILEDDVELSPRFCAILNEALARPVGWDLLKLAGQEPSTAEARVLARLDGAILARQVVPSLLTTAYVVTQAGAQRILAHVHPVREPYDFFLRRRWRTGLDICDVLPYPAHAAPFYSTIMAVRDYGARPGTLRGRLRSRMWRVEQSLGKRVTMLRWFGLSTLVGLRPLDRVDLGQFPTYRPDAGPVDGVLPS